MIGKLASSVGKGLFAGLAGTAIMTVSSTIEMKLQGREASTAPSDAAGKVLGVQPRNPEGKKRFSNVVHWGYGTTWGALRGLIGAAGFSGPTATAIHFASVWGSALVMLPVLVDAPPVTEQPPSATAIDAGHHLVYAAVTNVVYELLDR
ncbi:MAG: hypothetical protein H0U53_03480 [Actinobacteria bacterium]|nr:hypothetical protein [Actinomycetota bacterium]